jgi:RNA-binding protein
MITSKQRAHLRSLAMKLDPIFHVGKSSITPELTAGIDEALEARELVKISVLKNCLDEPMEIAHVLAERTRSELVQVIGKKFVLYRESKEKKKIVLTDK